MRYDTLAEEFLRHRRIAVVGVSRNPKDFSRRLFRELLARGYDAVPVNPTSGALEGRHCFPRLREVQPPPEAVLFLTPPAMTERLLEECPELGVRSVWLHRGVGEGAMSARAVEFCKAHGIEVVPGACPFMYLRDAGWIHRLHGFIERVWPRRAA
jgi:predicted CoA-binding protein